MIAQRIILTKIKRANSLLKEKLKNKAIELGRDDQTSLPNFLNSSFSFHRALSNQSNHSE